MATKSIKSKIEKYIICLVILIPAIILISLYPRMGKIYEERLEKEIAREDELQDEVNDFNPIIQDNFVNYAMEASYYLYGQLLQKTSSESSDLTVLDENGWINDYYQVNEGSVYLADYFPEDGIYNYQYNANGEYRYFVEQLISYGVEGSDLYSFFQKRGYALEDILEQIEKKENLEFQEKVQQEVSEDREYDSEEETQPQKYPNTKEVPTENTDLGNPNFFPYNGYLLIDFDSFGNITDIFYKSLMDKTVFYDQSYLYSKAMESIRQYEHNVAVHNENGLEKVEANALRPKNFRGIFLVKNDSGFVYTVNNYVNPMSNLNYYVYHQMHVEWIVFAMAGFVALMALLLPFAPKVYEGKGRALNLTLESSLLSLFLSATAGILLYHMMMISSLRYIEDRLQLMGSFELVGRDVSASEIYYFILVFSFVGWCISFALLYFGVASLRKFLENPKFYIKEKLLTVKVFRYSICHGRKYVIGFFSGLKKICYFICHGIKNIWKCFWNWFFQWQLDSKSKFFILKVVVLQTLFVLAAVILFNTLDLWTFVIYAAVSAMCMWLWLRKIKREYSSISKVTEEMAGGNLKTELNGDFGPFNTLAENLKKIQSGFSEAVAKEASSQNMKTELITNVSHDLKTPLTAIITYVDLLKKEDITEEERRQYIETLEKKSARLKVLIEDLFEISKAASNNIRMNYADVDIVNLIKQLKLENEDKFEKSSLHFIWNLPDEKIMLRLDPNRTYRIIDNLVQNILKYSMAASRVYIDLEESGEKVKLTLKNMSATAMNFNAKEITERFVRGDLSRNTEGSGLGLAIAKSFTEIQGGSFEISVDGDLFKVEIQFEREKTQEIK